MLFLDTFRCNSVPFKDKNLVHVKRVVKLHIDTAKAIEYSIGGTLDEWAS